MLEDAIKALTVAVEKNTAALTGGKAPAATTTKATTAKEPAAPSVTFEDVKAACNKVAKEIGVPKAQKIILDVGGAAQLANVKPGKFAALLAAAQAALTPPDNEEADPDAETEL